MIKSDKKIIGRLEFVDLPDWDINGIVAKIDTGAYSSSLHCHNINKYMQNNTTWVHFNLLDPDHLFYNEKLFKLPISDEREVKSSNGQSQKRIFVQTRIKFFEQIFDIELSLTNRSEMKHPLLIGRKFLKNKFLVDVAQKHISN